MTLLGKWVDISWHLLITVLLAILLNHESLKIVAALPDCPQTHEPSVSACWVLVVRVCSTSLAHCSCPSYRVRMIACIRTTEWPECWLCMRGLGTLEMLTPGVTKHFACMLMATGSPPWWKWWQQEICSTRPNRDLLQHGEDSRGRNRTEATVCLVLRSMGSKASEADPEDLFQGVVCSMQAL